jgi:hypothetical protein
MTVIKSSVFKVLEKFPDRNGDIKRLYKKAGNFKPCVKITASAPRRCTTGINRMKKRRQTRRQEYEQLFQELMDEIYLYLNESV